MAATYAKGYSKDDINICARCKQTCKDHEMVPMKSGLDEDISMACPACKKCCQFVRVPEGKDIGPYMASVDGLVCVFGLTDD